VAQLQIDLPFDTFLQSMLQVIQIEDIYIGLVKNALFGIAISIVSCYQGMQVRISTTEVPQRTTKAVVGSIFFCFFFNIIFTVAFYI
jgi:phospholipid/cholesterol/gamma-HCH transport system permease protein